MSVKIKYKKGALERAVRDAAASAANDLSYDVECPHCGKQISIKPGKSTCPYCGTAIDLSLDINF